MLGIVGAIALTSGLEAQAAGNTNRQRFLKLVRRPAAQQVTTTSAPRGLVSPSAITAKTPTTTTTGGLIIVGQSVTTFATPGGGGFVPAAGPGFGDPNPSPSE